MRTLPVIEARCFITFGPDHIFAVYIFHLPHLTWASPSWYLHTNMQIGKEEHMCIRVFSKAL